MNKTLIEHVFGYVLLVLAVFTVNAQWVKTDVIYGGVISSVAVSDSIVLIGTQQGRIFRSNDDGTTWSQILHIMSPDLRDLGCFGAITMNANGIYIEHVSYGMDNSPLNLEFSEDGGISWRSIICDIPHYPGIMTWAISGTTLFAANGGRTVYQSTDNGKSWSEIAYDFGDASVSSIAAFDSIVIVIVKDSDDIISTDYGTTWRTLNSGFATIRIKSIVVSNGTIFAAAGNGILKSIDNGSTWTYDSAEHITLTSLVAKDGMLFTGTYDGVYCSTDEGFTWNAKNSGLNNVYITDIAVKGDMLFVGSNGNGVFRSTDNGTTWVPINSGIKNGYYNSLVVKGNTVFVGMRYGGIVYSSNNGEKWSSVNSGSAFFNDIRCMTANKSSIFIGTDVNGIFRSDDNGATWSAANTGIANAANGTNWITSIQNIAANDSSIVASSVYDGIFRSIDNGSNWVKVDSGIYFTDLISTTLKAVIMFIGVCYNSCYISTDYGRSWSNKNPVPSAFGYIYSVAAIKNTIYAGTYNGIVCCFSDTGTNWTEITSGLPKTGVWELAVSGDNLFAGTDSGCFVYNTAAARWVAINSNLPSGAIGRLAATDSMLFAITSDGIWRQPLPEIVGIKDRQPRQESIQHTSPGITVSPYSNRCTAISLSLERANHMTLSIYNLQGRLLTTLADTYLRPGVYKYIWNPDAISLGNYYVKMQVGVNIFVKCITIVK